MNSLEQVLNNIRIKQLQQDKRIKKRRLILNHTCDKLNLITEILNIEIKLNQLKDKTL